MQLPPTNSPLSFLLRTRQQAFKRRIVSFLSRATDSNPTRNLGFMFAIGTTDNLKIRWDAARVPPRGWLEQRIESRETLTTKTIKPRWFAACCPATCTLGRGFWPRQSLAVAYTKISNTLGAKPSHAKVPADTRETS